MDRQPGFFDLDERYAQLSKSGDPLERLSAVVNFGAFRYRLEKALKRSDGAKGGIVEILGSVLGVDMGEWSSDDTFFDLGPRQGRHARYGPEDGRSGRSGRQRHDDSTGKVLKEIIRDALSSENGRNKKEGWFAFPFAAYRTTEGISLVAATKRVAEHFKPETR